MRKLLTLINFVILILSCVEKPTANKNSPPTALFTVSPAFGDTTTTFQFNATGSSDDQDISSTIQVRWDWDGDDSWDTNYSTIKTARHQYSATGTYSVKLEVKDAGGLTHSTTRQVSIYSGTMTDIDGNIYPTVKIGNQWWMAENLKVTKYRNGEAIPNITDDEVWIGLSTGAMCAYYNNDSYIDYYGLLYNWHAVKDSRNIAPAGWHVPTDEEWKQLEVYLGMSQSEVDDIGYRGTDEGSKLKMTNYWYNHGNGTNSSGFSALPAGYRRIAGLYDGLGSSGRWWSSTDYNKEKAWYRKLHCSLPDIEREFTHKQNGLSVRLVRD